MNLTEIDQAHAEVANAFVAWADVNEIAEPPLDWAWFGEITRRYSPLHEEHEGLTTARVRVDQTILAGDPLRQGNCVSACAATYLGLPLTAVPHFVEYDGATVDGTPGGSGWWWLLVGFMAARGLWPVDLSDVTEGEPGELLFVAGKSERGVLHQVLYRDGVLWHDPHPSRAGLLAVTEVIAWRPRLHDHEPSKPPVSPATNEADQ